MMVVEYKGKKYGLKIPWGSESICFWCKSSCELLKEMDRMWKDWFRRIDIHMLPPGIYGPPSTLLKTCISGKFEPDMERLLSKYPFLVEMIDE